MYSIKLVAVSCLLHFSCQLQKDNDRIITRERERERERDIVMKQKEEYI